MLSASWRLTCFLWDTWSQTTASFQTAAHDASQGSIKHLEESAYHLLPHSWVIHAFTVIDRWKRGSHPIHPETMKHQDITGIQTHEFSMGRQHFFVVLFWWYVQLIYYQAFDNTLFCGTSSFIVASIICLIAAGISVHSVFMAFVNLHTSKTAPCVIVKHCGFI